MSQDARKLAIALEAALRWQYAADTIEHIKNGVPTGQNFDASYVYDVAAMRVGVEVAKELFGIDITGAARISKVTYANPVEIVSGPSISESEDARRNA